MDNILSILHPAFKNARNYLFRTYGSNLSTRGKFCEFFKKEFNGVIDGPAPNMLFPTQIIFDTEQDLIMFLLKWSGE